MLHVQYLVTVSQSTYNVGRTVLTDLCMLGFLSFPQNSQLWSESLPSGLHK